MSLKGLTEKMPYKWRVQSSNDKCAACVAYIDARDAQDLLDKVVGPENWQDEYKMIGDRLYCGVSIFHDGRWVTKWDCGTESNMESEKGQASDAFKRACVKWGIGRFLYRMDIVRLKSAQHNNGKYYPCNDDGKMIFDGDKLSEYIEHKLSRGR